jgi:endonuclease/exonuclease/phosphatase family metal-dependent hydrolase
VLHRRTLITAGIVGAVVGLRELDLSSRPEDALRIATYNLRNFPAPAHDLEYVASTLEALAADIIAFQEVRDPGALVPLLPMHSVRVSARGGLRAQKLGLAIDTRRVQLRTEPWEDARVDLGGRVRPAFVAELETAIGQLSIVNVHLKAGRQGAEARRTQWSSLCDLVAELQRPIVVLGDFNATGGAAERTELADVLRSADLVPLHNDGCSAYWDGVRHDGWQEPSLLDLAFMSNAAEIGALDRPVAHAHCARHACEPFVSTEAHPDRDLLRASDHCPVSFDLRQL